MVASHILRYDVPRGMSRCTILFLTFLSIGLIACANNKPIVVIDHRWNIDYAKSACEHPGNPCVGDSAVDVNDFETRLITAFAAQPTCSNVIVIGPTGKIGLEPYWLLMLDFTPGSSDQSWSVVHTADSQRTRIRKGNGDPDQIANSICTTIKQTGASIRE